MYKDKDKQRAANKERQRRYKARQKGVTSEGVTDKALPDGVIPVEIQEFEEMLDEMERDDMPVNLELCRPCQEPLPKLEKPRKYPGKCYECVFPAQKGAAL